MTSDFIRIPQDRIGVLIGKGGETKREIEKKTHSTLKIDSIEGEIEVISKDVTENFFKAKDIVRAIGRGFSPERAFRLFEKDCFLSVLELSDIASSKKELFHKRGRIIGSSGRARKEIEEQSNASVCVYGKTIGIIGKQFEIEKARKAVEMLLHGADHSKVFDSLKRNETHKKFEL